MTEINRRNLLGAGMVMPFAATISAEQLLANGKPDLAGKSVLITGVSSGFGRLGALLYAERGAKVIATMRNLPRNEATELAAIAKGKKLDLQIVEIDVLDDDSVARGSAEAKELIGGAPDVLINNAGLAIVGPIEAQDSEASKLAFDTNVIGYQRMQRAVLPAMRARKSGHIINISSQSGRMIWPGLGNYCPTKFAIEAMSESLAYEVAMQGIEVTIIQPGGYPTDFWENRERYTLALKQRTGEAHLKGYGAMADNMGSGKIPNLSGDPMDVPNAIAAAIALPAGQKPLRVMVGAMGNPQASINDINRETHLKFLGRGPVGDAARKVHG